MKTEDIVIDQLYQIFQKHGYVTEEEIYTLCEQYELSFLKTDYVGNQLLAKGVLIGDKPHVENDEEPPEAENSTQFNYEEIYQKILQLSPELAPVVDFARREPPLKKGELKLLIAQVNSGNRRAKNIIVRKYIKAALRFALNYQDKTTLPMDDIFSEAIIGLMKAIDNYDPYKTYRVNHFTAYASWWMRQNVDRHICECEYPFRLPVHFVEKVDKVKRLELIIQELNREESIATISEYLDATHNEAEMIYDLIYMEPPLSIEELLENDEDIVVSESLYHEDSVEEIVESRLPNTNLLKLIEELPERERQVIILRYGFNDQSEKTLEEVGSLLSVTRERIRQIESKALRHLKGRLDTQSKKKNASPKFMFININGETFYWDNPGPYSGNNISKVYGKVDCTSKKHASHQVFFIDEKSAISAGYRPCPYCLKEQYKIWSDNILA